MAVAKFKIESGAQLLARLTKKTRIENFCPHLFNSGLNHGDTVEIFSNVNTSHLIIEIIMEALYPTDMNKAPVGVLMFNTTGNLIYEHLINTVRTRILKCATKPQGIDIDRVLHDILKNLFLLEIYDATQLYTTIHNLESVFIKHSNISLVIIDSLAAFYWSEQGLKITKMDFYIKNLLKMIQNVSKEYKVILIYTRPGYFSSNKDTDNLEVSEITDGIHCKVELVDKSAGDYQVNFKTVDTYYVKYYKIVDNILKWQ